MGNGKNEPIAFTREDAERLRTIEVQQAVMHDKLDQLTNGITTFVNAHDEAHTALVRQIDDNTRFRRYTTRAIVWLFSSTVGVALLTAIAKSVGWLN